MIPLRSKTAFGLVYPLKNNNTPSHDLLLSQTDFKTGTEVGVSGRPREGAKWVEFGHLDISPAPSPEFEILEEGSVAEASGPDSAELPTSQNLADVAKKMRANRHSELYLSCSSLFNQRIEPHKVKIYTNMH